MGLCYARKAMYLFPAHDMSFPLRLRLPWYIRTSFIHTLPERSVLLIQPSSVSMRC